MNTVVCLKQVLDPDLPARDFKINSERLEAERGSANLVTNIFCENALETALQVREKAGAGKVTALCFGTAEAEDVLRKALAMTADEAILVLNEGGSKPDAATVAKVLAAAIKKLGDTDLVMVGRESGDWGVGQTGGLLAEELAMPSLAFVDTVEPTESGLSLKRQTDSGSETAVAETPVLVLITNNELNVPRIPKTRDVMMSYRKPLQKLTTTELGLSAEDVAGDTYYQVVDLSVPEKDVQCELVAGDTLEEKVTALAEKIHAIAAAV